MFPELSLRVPNSQAASRRHSAHHSPRGVCLPCCLEEGAHLDPESWRQTLDRHSRAVVNGARQGVQHHAAPPSREASTLLELSARDKIFCLRRLCIFGVPLKMCSDV